MITLTSKKNFIINVIYYAFLIGLFFLSIKYVIPYISPFIIAFLVAFILKSPINWISHTFKVSRKLTAAIVLLLSYGFIVTILFLIGGRIFIFLKELFYHFPTIYLYEIQPTLFILINKIEDLLSKLDPALIQSLTDIGTTLTDSLATGVTELSTQAISFISAIATYIPALIINVLITIIASFFFTIDYSHISRKLMISFSPKIRSLILDIKNYLVGTVLKLAKAYAILLIITFMELIIGLSILHIHYTIAIALLTAFLDILPIFGTGSILIPWAIFSYIKGDASLAIGLSILYIIITVIRNILEPKIIGVQIGLHPIITLMAMFIGVKLFGFLGLFIMPISIIVFIHFKSHTNQENVK